MTNTASKGGKYYRKKEDIFQEPGWNLTENREVRVGLPEVGDSAAEAGSR